MKTVRARLLGVMTAIVIPVAAAIGAVAYSGYAVEVRDVRLTQATVTNGRGLSIRSWLDTTGRSLADAASAAAFLDSGQCAALAKTLMRRNADYAGVRLLDKDGRPCADGELIDLARLAAAPSSSAVDAGSQVEVVGGRLWVATTELAAEAGSAPGGVLTIQPEALRARLKPRSALGEMNVALLAGTTPIAQSGAEGAAWLPTTFPASGFDEPWLARDRSGREAAFAVAPAFDHDLSILVRFDERRLIEAWRRLVALCLTPLALLAVLAFTYASSIQRNVVRWIKSIEAAARLRSGDPDSSATAPVNASMPSELRSVAETFNAMAGHAAERRQALQVSLAENQALMQEMHHRIKNSLQVIQSYLALIGRMGPRADSVALPRISSRISVFAIAYRMALTPSGMRPVSVRTFLDEVVSALFMNLRRPYQRATALLEWDGELVVDRAIPLGLGMVESVIAGIEATGATIVAVRLRSIAEGQVELIVTTDGARAEDQPPDRIMAGLASQLGATRMPLSPGQALVWRFSA